MERRLNLSKEKTDEYDEKQSDSGNESIDPQHMNMQINGNAENLPLTDFSNQNATALPAFGSAFPRFAFSALRQGNLFHVSNSGPSFDDQSRISDAQFEEGLAYLSPTSGIRQIALGLQSNDIAQDNTYGNVPDYIETVSSSLCLPHNWEISASLSHEAANHIGNPDILNNEICLLQSLQQNKMEPILCPTRTNTETSDGYFCLANFQNTDVLPEQIATLVDPIVYHDNISNTDQAVEVSSCMEDYDPLVGTSTRNTWASTDKSSNFQQQKEFCKSVGFDGVLNQHSLSSHDKCADTFQTDTDLVGPNEDSSIMNMQAQLNSPLLIHTGEKPHECNICHKQFQQKYHLKMHFRTHTGEKPHECKICHKRFTEKGKLNRHIGTHSDKKPYECEMCSKRFTRKDHLSRHSKKHTSEDPFKCEICREFCFDIDSFNRHKRTHHEK